MAITKDDYFTAAVILVGAWLLIGCVTSNNVTVTPTPTPFATVTQTATPTPIPTPTARQCPASCEDGNPCTADDCGARTDFLCEHSPLNGPVAGCIGDMANCTEHSCIDGVCGSRPKVPCCGNSLCEQGEGCSSCPADCRCTGGFTCCSDQCVVPVCSVDAQCNDNDVCTRDVCTTNGTCGGVCQHITKSCIGGDGCCPTGCDYVSDNDCPAHSKGQWARGKNGLSIVINGLMRRSCIASQSMEKEWLVLNVGLRYDREGSIYFEPANITITDMETGLVLSPSNPTGTDCYTRDADFFLDAGNYAFNSETSGLVYYYPNGVNIRQTAKRVVVDMGGGDRLVWLIAPE